MPDRDSSDEYDDAVLTRQRQKTKPPRLYQVILHNDDYTPMEFVVLVLETVFRKSSAEATQIMLNVHKRGLGVCGVFPFSIAESKVQKVRELASTDAHPLRCSMEEI